MRGELCGGWAHKVRVKRHTEMAWKRFNLGLDAHRGIEDEGVVGN